MNIILTTGVLLIVVSFLLRKILPPYWGILVVFLIMGFQEGVEGDFMHYKEEYNEFSKYSTYQTRTVDDEPVWDFLYNTCARKIPFWTFIILLAGFECLVLFMVTHKYGSKEYGWLGPILFFFTFYMMLIQMKALRQGLAVELGFLSYYMTTQKRGILWSIIILAVAYFTHNSAIVLAPFIVLQIVMVILYGMDNDEQTIGEYHNMAFPIVMLIIYLIVYSLKSTSIGDWLSQIATIIEDSEFRGEGYLETENKFFDVSWLIVLYDGVMVFLCSWFIQRTTRRNRILAIASIIGCYCDMLLFGMGTLPRVMMFFYVFNILTYPLIAEMIHNKYGFFQAMIFVIFLIGYAVKTSLPMILGTSGVFAFAPYRFVFIR